MAAHPIGSEPDVAEATADQMGVRLTEERRMNQSPPGEIVLRWAAVNRKNSGSILQFIDGGRPRLVQSAARLADRLRKLRAIFKVEALIGGGFPSWTGPDPILWVAELVSSPGEPVFVSGSVSTKSMLAAWYLQDFGYTLRDGCVMHDFLGLSVWESIAGDDVPLICEGLRKFWAHPYSPQLGADKLKSLILIGRALTAEAEHVPFGSLACAIGRKLDTTITLWSFNKMDQSSAGGRAIRYRLSPGNRSEEIILFAPSSNHPSSLDFETRYAVAHELAHIALQHPPRLDGPSPQKEEVEAHYLAAIFLRLHGAPADRKAPSQEAMASILMKTDLPAADQMHLLDRFATLGSELEDGDEPWQDDLDALGVTDCEEEAEGALQRFGSDEALRDSLAVELGNQPYWR